jgi:hypothetical protein
VFATELSLRVARDHEVVAFGEELVREARGREAFWAVSGPGERDEQSGDVLAQAALRVGDQIGGRDGIDTVELTHPTTKGWAQHLTDVCRCSGTGQHDAESATFEERAEERLMLIV